MKVELAILGAVTIVISAVVALLTHMLIYNAPPIQARCPLPSQHITYYADGTYFVPAGSGLGPPLTQVKTYITYDGTQCDSAVGKPVARMEDLRGLICRKAP